MALMNENTLKFVEMCSIYKAILKFIRYLLCPSKVMWLKPQTIPLVVASS